MQVSRATDERTADDTSPREPVQEGEEEEETKVNENHQQSEVSSTRIVTQPRHTFERRFFGGRGGFVLFWGFLGGGRSQSGVPL